MNRSVARYVRIGAGVLSMAAASAVGASSAGAQIPSASAAALGTGDNYTAAARGFSAVAWNPAGLGMPGNPGVSFTLFAPRGVSGLGPVGPSDFRDYEGELIPLSVRREWYERIIDAGGEEGAAGADLTYVALQVGRFGVQLSSSANMVGSVGPGIAELILFGNAGRTGQLADIELGGSSIDVAATSTVAVAYGHPIVRGPDRLLSVGGTLTYTVGHVLLAGLDLGGSVRGDPLGLEVSFPMALTDTESDDMGVNNGRGIGLDLGTSWQQGPLVAALVVRNLFNTFAWDEGTLSYRPGQAFFTEDDNETDFESRPFAEAPPLLRDRVEDLGFSPAVAAGVAYTVYPELRVSADVRHRLGDSASADPKTHIGGGAEYNPLGWLPLRAGAAVITDGFAMSAGLGLRLGPAHLTVGGTRRWTGAGNGGVAMFTFSGGAL